MAMAEMRTGQVPAHLDSDDVDDAAGELLHDAGLADVPYGGSDVGRGGPDAGDDDPPPGEASIEGGFRLKGYGMPNMLPVPTSATAMGSTASPRWLKVPASERLTPQLQQHSEVDDEGAPGVALGDGGDGGDGSESDGAAPAAGGGGPGAAETAEPYVILHSVPPISTGRAPISPPRLPVHNLHSFHPAADDSIAEAEGDGGGDDDFAAHALNNRSRNTLFAPSEDVDGGGVDGDGGPEAPASWPDEEQAEPQHASAAWKAAEAEEQAALERQRLAALAEAEDADEVLEEEPEQQQAEEEDGEAAAAADEEVEEAAEEEETADEAPHWADAPHGADAPPGRVVGRLSIPADGPAFLTADSHQRQQQQSPSGTPQARYQPPARKMANPMGTSKGSLMGMAGPVNPDAEVIRASDVMEEVRAPAMKVADMGKQLKEHFETGASLRRSDADDEEVDPAAANGARASLHGLKQHDMVNTANVALLLQAGEFRLLPGVDVIPYDELKELRLEDGLDVSRKEEYLSEEEFEEVFGMDKEDFRAMPPWKRINAKKSKGLF